MAIQTRSTVQSQMPSRPIASSASNCLPEDSAALLSVNYYSGDRVTKRKRSSGTEGRRTSTRSLSVKNGAVLEKAALDAAGQLHAPAQHDRDIVDDDFRQEPHFRLMDLPTELRLHIFRCALVRPYEILLHKDQPVSIKTIAATDDRDDDETHDNDANDQHAGDGSNGTPHPDLSNTRPQVSRRLRTRSQTARARAELEQHTQLRREFQERLAAAPVKKQRPQDQDPLNAALLRVSQTVYKEARQVLYSENTFFVDFDSGVPTMQSLHQRSRSMIRHIKLTIPCPSDILDEFADLVRLAIRYCWHLQKFEIVLPFRLTTAEYEARNSIANRATIHMYANSFNILRWLPRQTKVTVEGEVCDEIRKVISQNETLAKILDDQAYARRQHQISDKPTPVQASLGRAA